MKKLFLLYFIICSLSVTASVFNGDIQSFKQPDGALVDVKLFGAEYYMRGESLDGFTVLRDPATNFICYAKLSDDGNKLLSTGIIYYANKTNHFLFNNTLNLSKHLDINAKAKSKVVNSNMKALGGTASHNNMKMSDNMFAVAKTPIHPVSGNIKGLCLVVDFSDEPGILPLSDFIDFCNGFNYTGFGNNGSLRQYYSDISGGILDYENEVYGYFRAPLTFAAYDAMPYATGAQQILGLALNWLDAQGFDFSTLSTNSDSSITAINLMYTGNPPNWAQGMWHHKGYYDAFSADGVHSGDYNCSPANSPLVIGVVAHENGHMIGKWPDTYKYYANTGPDGIGTFDLMCYYGSSSNPTTPNPLFLNNVGWGNVIDVTGYNGINTDTANSSVSYLYRNINDSNEFFLFQNRLQSGRSSSIQDEGLTVWHIDRNGDNQTLHHEVFLEHADDDLTNEFDACFHSGIYNEFGENTIPGSAFYNGDPSGLRIWDIGPENTYMTYKLGSSVAGPSLKLSFVSLTNDNNNNGFFEPAESADMNVMSFNYGQINSANATIKCTAVGANASMVTVNTATVAVGAINVAQSVPATFNLSLLPGTPPGTQFSIRFSISDGTDSIYITHNFIAGVTINMDNQPDTLCSAVFYDEGGIYNYSNETNFTKTFFPSVTSQKIEAAFISFYLEDEINCGYDYLKIYDGPSDLSPLIGTYCGTNNPGIVTSTNPGGALTFKFHSDEGATDSGWVAIISCKSATGINQVINENAFQLYPNPSTGLIHFTSPSISTLVTLFDISGKQLWQKEFEESKENKMDLSAYADGIYQIKFQTQNGVVVKKLLLNR